MRILFLLTQDLDSPSGLGRYWPMARELARLGHTITIAALHSDYGSLPRKRFRRDGVSIWYVAPMHVRKQGNIKSYYSTPRLMLVLARATWALSWAALTIPADIIHIGKPHPMNGVAGLLGHILRGRQVYLDCDDYETKSTHFTAGWQKQVVTFFEKWLPHRVDIITTHTHFNRLRLQEDGISSARIFYISNGVDPERFAPPDPQKVLALRRELGLAGRKVITFIGSLSLANHPVDLLLKGFVGVHQVQPEIILLIVGGGEDFEKLRLQAEALGIGDTTIFCGRVSPEEVGLYYHLSDVTVDPVYDDAAALGRSPLKLFESWACGVPFVSAEVGERRFLLGDPPAGLLAKPGNPQSLTEAILAVLNDQNLANELRKRGLERVKAYFWDQLVIELDILYRGGTLTGN